MSLENNNYMFEMVRTELIDAVGADYVNTGFSDRFGHSIDYYWIPEMWHDRGKETKKPDKTLQKEQTDQKEFDQEKKKITDDFEKSTKELQIQAGDWSADVSRKLEGMDVISDAEAFDAYMDKHGYSSKIKAGNYSISPGADFDQIAKEITSK